ncbi:hypothetical protein GOP47_0020962 [Adiantum capillus-veneris]|uniref:Uncharacterized protein n=1 Tax=Adiantum capillus-veneris TaxID=13818 RepID=A0A9D4UAK0_ADICA|nr:hypothetical protein GOP47_0020962 [Adiantum capillus-veneris]
MGFSAPSLQFLTFLFSLALASLACNDCGASSLAQARHSSLGLHDPTGSLYWKVLRSKLRGEAQEEEKDMLEVLHELERGIHPEENIVDTEPMLWERSSNGEEVEEEEQEERHPADELLQMHQADATISYILGGY